MAERPTCESCVYWQEGGAKLSAAERDPAAKPGVGVCCVDPPALVTTPHFALSMFPETHASRFCGLWDGGPNDDDPGAREPADNVVAFGRGSAA